MDIEKQQVPDQKSVSGGHEGSGQESIEKAASINNQDVSSHNESKDLSANDSDDHVVNMEQSTAKSLGIRKAEALSRTYEGFFLKTIFFITIFFTSYAYAVESTIKGRLEAYATSSYQSHSLLSTVDVIRAVVAAAAQPTYARLSDKFGRLELILLSLVFYVVGTVIQSQAYDINRFAGGAVLYQIGYQGIVVLLQIVIADFTPLNWRLAISFVPALPFIINTWVSGDIMNSLYPAHSWNYGYGIWAFIFPLACIPMISCFIHMWLLVRKTEEWHQLLEEGKTHKNWTSLKDNILIDLFWKLDVIGILFIICVFGFILVPFTIAGGVQTTWEKASTIVPLVIGVVLIPFFVLYEAKVSKFPILPVKLVKDRGVWAALIVAVFINFVWYLPNGYLYTVLIVGMNASIKAATRITSLYSFVSVIVGPLLGLLVVRVRRLKGFIIFGVCCWVIALGIMYNSRGADQGVHSELNLNGVIGALCLMGFGAGFFTYSTQVSIETCTNHEYMAIVLSLYLASYNIGSALGSSVSGAIWTNKLYPKLLELLTEGGYDASLATSAYGDPFTFVANYTWGTPERILVVDAYSHVQRYLCIAGLVLTFPLLFVTFFLRDHRLDSIQSLDQKVTHEKGVQDEEGKVILNDYDDDYILNALKKLIGKK